ncbi:MAG: hypothetical protein HOB82_00650 [Alphaproteobacteria bacterium]|nr:hypothetical protein [Alphaproteobacteria bacterium]MBT5861021.1 hypothetical protein [Alphaproteobacteria bacterium]
MSEFKIMNTKMRLRSVPIFKQLGAIVIVALAVAACGESQWTGTIYPDRENLRDFERVGVFATLDQCRAAATTAIGELGDRGENVVAGWDCGQNCSVDNDGDLDCIKYEQG